jgi:hypothetical protein
MREKVFIGVGEVENLAAINLESSLVKDADPDRVGFDIDSGKDLCLRFVHLIAVDYRSA